QRVVPPGIGGDALRAPRERESPIPLAQSFDERGVARRRELGRERVELRDDRIDLPQLLRAQRRNDEPAPGIVFDQAFGLELDQRLPQRRAARPERLAERDLPYR